MTQRYRVHAVHRRKTHRGTANNSASNRTAQKQGESGKGRRGKITSYGTCVNVEASWRVNVQYGNVGVALLPVVDGFVGTLAGRQARCKERGKGCKTII